MTPDKLLLISKRMVWEAYQLIAGNGKAVGIDRESLNDLWDNLCKLWNCMAS